jgi:endonuclease-3
LPGKARPRPTPRSRRAPAAAANEARHLTGARGTAAPAGTRRKPSGAESRAGTARRRARAAKPVKLVKPAARTPKRATAGRATAKRVAAKPPVRATAARAAASRRFAPPDPARVNALLAGLRAHYPAAITALDFGTPLQLLVATILSAQCTDERVNKVTPALFARYPDARAFAAADRAELEELIRSTGFYRNKAKSILACTRDIVAKHGGEVPGTLGELTQLHGVGRKTANVVLGNAFGIPGLVVDTHVSRLAQRMGLTNQKDPVKIEFALMPIVPREDWTVFSHWLILHGRAVCNARKPFCSRCPVAAHCPRRGVGASQ